MNRFCLIASLLLVCVVAPLKSQFLPLHITRDSAIALLAGGYRDSVSFQRFFGEDEDRDTLEGLLDAIQLGPTTLAERSGRTELQFDSSGRLVKILWETGPGLLSRQDPSELQPDSAAIAFVDVALCQRLRLLLAGHYGLKDKGENTDTTLLQLRWPADTMVITLNFNNPMLLSVAIRDPTPLPRSSQFIMIRLPGSYPDPPAKPSIFSDRDDARGQLRRGIDSAAATGKRPLLLLGASWCYKCDSLYNVMANDTAIAQMLKRDFHLVLVNMGDDNFRELNQQLGDPLRLGLPVLMLLDGSGTPRNASEFSAMNIGESYNPTMVRSLIQEWRK